MNEYSYIPLYATTFGRCWRCRKFAMRYLYDLPVIPGRRIAVRLCFACLDKAKKEREG